MVQRASNQIPVGGPEKAGHEPGGANQREERGGAGGHGGLQTPRRGIGVLPSLRPGQVGQAL